MHVQCQLALASVILRQAYLCGETVSGLLHLTLKESKSYKYIETKFHGGVHAHVVFCWRW